MGEPAEGEPISIRPVDARLAIPAIAGWLAALILVGLPDAAGPTALGAAGFAGALVAAIVVGRRATATATATTRGSGRAVEVLVAGIPSVLAIAVMALAVALAAPARAPQVIATELATGGAVLARVELEQTVIVSNDERWGSSASALVVAVHEGVVGDPDARWVAVRVPVRILGITPESLPATARLPIGTLLEGRLRLIPLEAGDDRAALARPIDGLVTVASAAPLLGGADGLRAEFLHLMSEFGGDGAALLPGLAIGDTTAVSDELDAAMKRSALSHLTAVSGANCAIIVGLVLGIGALARWPRAVRVAAALAALAGFVVLVTPQPSVVRASVMAAVVLVALVSGRPARGLPVLGIAVLAILVVDPWIARDYGFALSVLATAALLLLAGPLAERLQRIVPPAIALWIAVPLAAQLACQPVLILLAPEVPLAGVLANILAAPAAPLATIIGMIACLLAPIAPPLALLVAAIAWLPAAWIAGVARVCSTLPGATLPWIEGPGGAALLAVLTIGGLLATGVPAPLGSPRGRRRLALATVMCLVVVAGATAGASWIGALGRPADWAIAQCDIGQGDAVLVRQSGQVALIDTGADDALLNACLDELGIERIDLLVLTHFDLDHVGAVGVVVGRVTHALVGPTGRPEDQRVVDALLAGGATVETVHEGARGTLGDYAWRVLWPPDHRGIEPGNDASLVLEWRGTTACAGACPSMLGLGDLGQAAQSSLLATGSLDPVDVVKVSHHGSPDQHPELYAAVHAALGLVGVGADNTYGHPAASILDVLAELGTTVARSDRHGLVLVAAAEGSALRLWQQRDTGAPVAEPPVAESPAAGRPPGAVVGGAD